MLRRFLLLLSAVALLVGLCGCAGVEIPFSAEPFTADVMFQSAGTDIKGEITYNSPSDIVFVVKEPENIKGISFEIGERVWYKLIEKKLLTRRTTL